MSETTTPIAPEQIGTTREALSIPAFRRLLAAWVTSNVADSALFLTIAVWVKTFTGSDTYTALIFVALGLPALVAPAFGLMADKFSRKMLVAVSNINVAALIFTLFFVRDAGDMWIVYAFTIAYSCTTYINSASQAGLLRDTIPASLLAPANGLFTAIDQGFRIVIPIIAAGAFAIWGIGPVLWVTAAMFLVSALMMLTLRITETKNDITSERGFLRTSLQGFPELRVNKRLWIYLMALVIVVTTGGAINTLIFPVLEHGLQINPEAISIFTGIQGVAAVCAGICAATLMRRFSFNKLMLVSLVAYALAYVSFAIPHVVAVGVSFALLGFCMPTMAMIVMTIKQTELPMAVQGRSGAAINMLLNVPQVLCSALVAVLLGFMPYTVILVAGALLATFSMIPIVRYSRSSGDTAP